MGKLFGTDGIRGVANLDLNAEIVFNIGRSAAYVLMQENKYSANILVGMDTRISGTMLESALISGMCSVGAKCISLGVVPTPAVAYLTKKYNMDAGVMISASHNPVEDNGIKFFNKKGYKLQDEIEDKIEDIVFNRTDKLPRPTGENIGFRSVNKKLVYDYNEFLKNTLEGIELKGIKIALDCANGATYKIAPNIFKTLGAEVDVLYNNPDGLNINRNCGSTYIESLVKHMKKNKYDIGISYDGDGDRCLVVDENGCVINGDGILSICGLYLKNKNKLKNNTIVVTVMTNLGFFMMCKDKNIKVEKTKVGDRYVLEKMLEGNYNLGGEQSGHIIFLDYNSTGDGILTSLQILKIMKETNKKLSELNKEMIVMPQVVMNARVRNDKKYDYIKNEIIKKEIDIVERKFANDGRVLIRASGTEPLIRVMIEGKDKDLIKKEAKHIVDIIEKSL